MSEEPQERRKGMRIPSHEPVCFTGPSGWGSLHVGSLQDRSARGVAIQTDSIYPVGTPLEIEVVSNADQDFDGPQFSKGKVSRIEHRPQGGYILGVYLNPPRNLSTPIMVPSELINSARPLNETTRLYQKPLPVPELIQPGPVVTKPQRAYAQHTIATMILLLSVALFVGWGVNGAVSSKDVKGLGNTSTRVAQSDLPIKEEGKQKNPQRRVDSALHNEGSVDALPSSHAPVFQVPQNAYTLPTETLQASLGAQANNRARSSEALPASVHESVSLAQVYGTLEQAQTFARNGNRMGALYLSQEATKQAAQLPKPWRVLTQEFRQQLLQQPNTLPTLSAWNNGLALAQVLPEVPANAPVVVHVDKSDFLLKVIKDETVIWQFPIGLGLNDTTPEGIFSVGTKLSFPAWYNKGNPVQGGAPNNPLGDSWVGMSDQGTATPFGIHPTQQGESIGQSLSGGCIRMRPQDAERLYRMIPLGTPIVIRA